MKKIWHSQEEVKFCLWFSLFFLSSPLFLRSPQIWQESFLFLKEVKAHVNNAEQESNRSWPSCKATETIWGSLFLGLRAPILYSQTSSVAIRLDVWIWNSFQFESRKTNSKSHTSTNHKRHQRSNGLIRTSLVRGPPQYQHYFCSLFHKYNVVFLLFTWHISEPIEDTKREMSN